MSFAPKTAFSPSAPGMMPKAFPRPSGMIVRSNCRVRPAEKATMASRTIGMQTS